MQAAATASSAPLARFQSKRIRRAKPAADALARLCAALDVQIRLTTKSIQNRTGGAPAFS